MTSIASTHNPLVKSIRKAIQKGALTDDGFCVAEGFHLLEEAVRSGCDIGAVLATEAALPRVERIAAATVADVPEKLLRELSTTETPQGVVSLVRPPSWTAQDLLGAIPLVLVLDGIQDPGNAGALLRSAEAFGATGAVLLPGTVNPYNPKCLRASAGSIFRLPLVHGRDSAEFWAAAAERSTQVYACMPEAGIDLRSADLAAPCAIVVGSEGAGIRPDVAERGVPVRIPTSGVESLNASIAGAILLYEASRQRSARP